jgi:hypothetical protein
MGDKAAPLLCRSSETEVEYQIPMVVAVDANAIAAGAPALSFEVSSRNHSF